MWSATVAGVTRPACRRLAQRLNAQLVPSPAQPFAAAIPAMNFRLVRHHIGPSPQTDRTDRTDRTTQTGQPIRLLVRFVRFVRLSHTCFLFCVYLSVGAGPL